MPTYFDYQRVRLSQDESQDLVAALIVVSFCVMALDITGPEVVFLVALCVLMLAEVLTINDTLSGFANDGLITIGSLFLVIGAIEKSHIVDYGARLAFGLKGSKEWGIFRMYTSSFLISAFFNNIPQVAIMIPVVKDWAKLRGISASQLLIPLSYSVLAGGMLATIGTSTNLVVQALLSNDPKNRVQFNFFDPAVVGLPAGMVLIFYMMLVQKWLLPHHENKESDGYDRQIGHVAEITIGPGSKFIGKTVGDFFGAIGITSDHFVKVRTPKVVKTRAVIASDPESGADVEGVQMVEKSKGNYSSVQTTESSRESSKTDLDAPNDDEVNTNRPLSAAFLVHYYNIEAYYDNLYDKIKSYAPTLFQLKDNYQVVVDSYIGYEKDEYVDEYRNVEQVIKEGDIIFAADSADVLLKLSKVMPWERKGISIYGGYEIMDIPAYGREIIELVLSISNPFLGKRLGDIAELFTQKYGVIVVSVRSQRRAGGKKGIESIQDNHSHVLEAGDSLIVLGSKKTLRRLAPNLDFASVLTVGKFSQPATAWSFYPAIMFMTIVSLVASEQIEMCPASLSMAAFLFVGGWLIPEDIERFVDIRLLMLMGTSLSFAKAMTTTGLASRLADAISEKIHSPTNALYLIYLATLIITEVISNNAAAALMYPLAVSLADAMGVSYRPFAMIVMQAASMAFMVPIGYPTHVMVWRPGQYGFIDFCKFGLIPDLLWWVLSCLICPAVWKF